MAITAANTLTLLSKYGADAVFREYESSSYDATTGKRTMGTATEHTAKVAEESRQDRVPGWADMLLYVSPSGLDFTPATQMEVVYAAKTWTVVSVEAVSYAGGVVLYKLAVKAVA